MFDIDFACGAGYERVVSQHSGENAYAHGKGAEKTRELRFQLDGQQEVNRKSLWVR